MNFTLLSPLGFAAGLLALAGGLFLLQRLRVRHREVSVVTTLFWREAVHDTRARVLVHRFRHPWAYALILAICALLWSAIAAPERDVEPRERYVLLLDSSAVMAHGSRFEEAKGTLLAMIDEVAPEAREVIACGAQQLRLLDSGEASLLLEARLEGLAPAASPSSVQRVIEGLALQGDVPTTVLLFGDAALDEDRLALLPESLKVERVLTSGEALASAHNTGITALGVSLAESGAWDAVDVLIEVASSTASSATPALVLDGQALTQPVQRRVLDGGVTQYLVSDVPARGGRFEARLAGGDDLALDDISAVVLPNRPLLRVSLSPTLDSALRIVLESDPAVVLVESGAQLVVRRVDEDLGSGLPALVFAPAATQEQSFLVQYSSEREPQAVLAEVVGELALSEIDATSLAEAADQPISLGAKHGAVRQVAVWQELIGEGFDFIDSRAFPLFVGASLRWLVGSEELHPWLAAGETRVASAALTNARGSALRPIGASAIPPEAGDYTQGDGSVLAVSLLSRAATLARPQGGSPAPFEQASAGVSDPVTWLLLLALLLLLFEWRQVRTGRMP